MFDLIIKDINECIYVQEAKNGKLYFERETPHGFEKSNQYLTDEKRRKNKIIITGLGCVFFRNDLAVNEKTNSFERLDSGRNIQRIYIELIENYK